MSITLESHSLHKLPHEAVWVAPSRCILADAEYSDTHITLPSFPPPKQCSHLLPQHSVVRACGSDTSIPGRHATQRAGLWQRFFISAAAAMFHNAAQLIG